jgi:hypothetical protein
MYLTQQTAVFTGQFVKNAKMKCSSVDFGGKSGDLRPSVSPLQPLEREIEGGGRWKKSGR